MYGALPSAPLPPSRVSARQSSVHTDMSSFSSLGGKGGYSPSSSPSSSFSFNNASIPTHSSPSHATTEAKVNPNLPIASQLVQNQNANGSFKDAALAVMKITRDQLKNNLPITGSEQVELVFLAALVCAYLELKCQKEQTSWTLVVKKAKNWIRKETERLNSSVELFETAATKLVSSL
eukprot:TRINITY_DN1512_c0_g1_i1.p1 TRINITY_DN1512_c0_g1~~TRINITY_DN1512_c0_g1_i1.p1  ORF type:complete len:178 (+),score=32.67 TRINITY_DN1512_c0_g1_i1:587-1120(+)